MAHVCHYATSYDTNTPMLLPTHIASLSAAQDFQMHLARRMVSIMPLAPEALAMHRLRGNSTQSFTSHHMQRNLRQKTLPRRLGSTSNMVESFPTGAGPTQLAASGHSY